LVVRFIKDKLLGEKIEVAFRFGKCPNRRIGSLFRSFIEGRKEIFARGKMVDSALSKSAC